MNPRPILRLASLAIALAYVIAIAISEGGATETLVKVSMFLLLPLALIWFPDELGETTGYVWRGSQVNVPSPPILVSVMGWVLLVGLPLVIYLFS